MQHSFLTKLVCSESLLRQTSFAGPGGQSVSVCQSSPRRRLAADASKKELLMGTCQLCARLSEHNRNRAGLLELHLRLKVTNV